MEPELEKAPVVACNSCKAENELDAEYCDQCAWPMGSTPELTEAPSRRMAIGSIFLAFCLLWGMADLLQRVSGIYPFETNPGVQAAVAEAKRYNLNYDLASALGPKAVGMAVEWDITPQGPGRAFYGGDWKRPISLRGGFWSHLPGGRMSSSKRVVARLAEGTGSVPAINVIGLR